MMAQEKAPWALPESRRTEVIRIITDRGSVSVPALVDLFQVSADTIRRDLDRLADSGMITRTHGGAVRLREAGVLSVAVRMTTRAEAKQRIAAAAVALIRPGETIVVNGGSTTLAFAAALPAERSVALVTNSIPILGQLDLSGFSNVFAIGGEFLDVSKVTVGPVDFPHSDRIAIDAAVIGVRAMNAERGISTATVAEAKMISEMIRLARRTIVVTDAEKFSRSAFAAIAPLSDIDTLVTDAEPPDDLRAALRAGGTEIIVA